MSHWMLSILLASMMLAGAALMAEEVARLLRLPRRWGWMVAMLLSAALPLLFRLFPVQLEPTVSQAASDPEGLARLLAGAQESDAAPSILRWLQSPVSDPYLRGSWLALATLVALALGYTWLRLRRVRSSADPVEIVGFPALLTRALGPMVVGVRRPEVMLPRWITSLPEAELRLVMRHEWEHVRARDTRLLLGSALLIAAMPWNVPLWWMRRRLRQTMEVDCDARVLASGADPRLYGRMLIQTAGRPAPAPLLAPALVEPPTLLERRIVAMTTKRPAHPRLRAAAATTLGLSLFIVACELTPRSSSLSPTEPTLEDAVEGDADVVAVTYAVVPDSGQLTRVVAADGQVTVMRISPSGDTTWLSAGSVQIERGALNNLVIEGKQPIYIVNDVEVASLEHLGPNTIQRINVLKGDAAVAEVGERGRVGGVVKIMTRDAAGAARAPSGAEAPVRVRVRDGEPVNYEAAVLTRDPEPIRPVKVVPSTTIRAEPARATGAAGASIGAPRVIADTALEAVTVVGYGTTARSPAPARTLEGVEAIGYGTATRAAVAGAPQRVRAIRAEDMATNPGATAVVIRGTVTRADSPQPLVIVDGEEFSSLAEFEGRYSPAQIESISVIKDASATALYGERGRNGVVLIKLKKQP